MPFEEEYIGPHRLIRGDCREVLPTLAEVEAVVTDPPYGIAWDTDYTRFTGGVAPPRLAMRAIVGDHGPFDPLPWLRFPSVVLWGAQHYTAHLPSGTWLVWDKRPPGKHGVFLSDGEVAWLSHGQGVYIYHQQWDGFNREGERQDQRVHPTQKPIALMRWCLEKTRGSVLDPFMGSGTTGVACVQLGRIFTGIEIEKSYFDIACQRLHAALAQPDLFIPQAPRAIQQPLFAGGA